MKRRSLNHDTFALSIMYDTLLFLCFVSLSGVVVLPMFYQQYPARLTQHQAHEEKVDFTLQTLLVSTADDFLYTTAGSIIDHLGSTVGINTSDDSGLFRLLVDWYLGKEQLHKSYEQLISENLATQFSFPISSNDTISLNVFSQDFTIELIGSIHSFLDDALSSRYSYNFSAYWYPIRSIPLGGSIELGIKPPSPQVYVAQRTISLPFLLTFSLGNESFVFSKQGLSHLFSHIIIENTSSLGNVSMLLALSNNSNNQPYNDTAITCLTENLTYVVTDLLTTGITLGNNTERIPGLLEWMIHSTLSPLLNKLENASSEYLSSGLDFTFGSFDSIFSTLNSSTTDGMMSEIQSMIVDQISQWVGISFTNLSNAIDQLVSVISQYVSAHLYDIVYTLMMPVAQGLINISQNVTEVIDTVIDFVFDQLSISTATVTLSIWERTL